VGVVPTTTTLAANPTSLTFAEQLTLTATVIAASSATPSGTITFLNGATSLGAAQLNTAGVATLSVGLGAGSYAITASYGGSTSDAPSVSSPPVAVTVAPIPTTTMIASSLNPAPFGTAVTFTATVGDNLRLPTNPAGLPPTGTVSFYDGAVLLGATTLADATGNIDDAIATYSTSALSAGSHNITAVYTGTSEFDASTSGILAQVITAATFTLSASPPAQTVDAGQPAIYTVTVAPGAGFNLPVALGCSQLVAATCSFSPATLSNGSWSSTLTVQTAAPGANQVASVRASGPLVLAGLLLMVVPRRWRRWYRAWSVALLGLMMLSAGLMLSGCTTVHFTPHGGTKSATQTIVVTGTAGAGAQVDAQTATVTLTVNSPS